MFECISSMDINIQARFGVEIKVRSIWLLFLFWDSIAAQFPSNLIPTNYGPSVSPYEFYPRIKQQHLHQFFQHSPGLSGMPTGLSGLPSGLSGMPGLPVSLGPLGPARPVRLSGPMPPPPGPPLDTAAIAHLHLPPTSLQNTSAHSPRDRRFLSLFTVVQFPRDICVTSAGDNGTCLSPPDCQKKGGFPTGPCASNFGVCCVFMSTCGSTVRENGTYFVNKGYPGAYNNTASTCQLTIEKQSPDVCQYRLDFEQFLLAGPEPVNHICNYDQFIVSGSNPVPIICGINNANHMYLDALGPVVLSITTSGLDVSRYWKIRITQISCPSVSKAEDGCLQYHTGISGMIKSFNYEPVNGLHLSNQDYSICIRTERNFCSIQYSQCIDNVNNRSHSFTLTGNTLGQNAISSMFEASNCNTDWLIIPCISNVGSLMPGPANCVDRICGGTLNAEPSTTSATVYSNVRPFRLHFHTNAVESPDMGNNGFCLHYVQQPCNNKI